MDEMGCYGVYNTKVIILYPFGGESNNANVW